MRRCFASREVSPSRRTARKGPGRAEGRAPGRGPLKPLRATLALIGLLGACVSPGKTTPTAAVVPSTRSTVDPPGPPAETHIGGSFGPAAAQRPIALIKALRTVSPHASDLEDVRVFSAFEDLNADGVDEAVVHVTGSAFCGTGGCTTLVYQWRPAAAAYAEIHKSPTTRPPIYASARQGCPWSMLWVRRSGGGRRSELRSPQTLAGVDPCNAPVGPWSDAEGKLLIPVFASRQEGARL